MGVVEIWGHRGAYRFAPENTLTGFQMAADMGADGVELDIQLSRDGKIVVIHDETLDRTSDGTGNVRDYTLAELKRLNFNKRGITPPAFMEIPTLVEVFDLLRPTRLTINVELKTGVVFYEDIERKALALAEKHGMSGRIVWSSFNHYSVARVLALEPRASAALLCGGVLITAAQCEAAGVRAIHPHIRQIACPGFMEDCRARGIAVRPWVADTAAEVRLAVEVGAAAVMTNRMDVVKDALESGWGAKK